MYVFLHISHENDSNFSKDGISLPALPGERFHFTKTGKRPEKQSHGDILKNFSLEQLTHFFGISYVLIETWGIQLQIATYCSPY